MSEGVREGGRERREGGREGRKKERRQAGMRGGENVRRSVLFARVREVSLYGCAVILLVGNVVP